MEIKWSINKNGKIKVENDLCKNCNKEIIDFIKVASNLINSDKDTLLESRKEALINNRSEATFFQSRFGQYLIIIGIIFAGLTQIIELDLNIVLILIYVVSIFITWLSLTWFQMLKRNQLWKNHWFDVAYISDWYIHKGPGSCYILKEPIKEGGITSYFYRFLFGLSTIFFIISCIVFNYLLTIYFNINIDSIFRYFLICIIGSILNIPSLIPFYKSLKIFQNLKKEKNKGNKWIEIRAKILKEIYIEWKKVKYPHLTFE